MSAERGEIEAALRQTLIWSRQEGYLEHTKHDALNSPLISAVFGHHRLSRIFATQAVMRFPLNLRPLLGVPKSHNPKGFALFALALLDRYSAAGQGEDLAEAERLLEVLLTLRASGSWRGDCWGYQYPWQDLGFFAPKGMPNAVVTSFVCEAFLQAYRMTGREKYLDVVESAAGFFLRDLPVLKSNEGELCLGYMPMEMSMRVMDVSILISSVLAQLHEARPGTRVHEDAMRLTRYVVNRQTGQGAWFYTDPPEASPVKVDNYHTGFILDALQRVMRHGKSEEWRSQYRAGLGFYAGNLFNADGSPKWMSDKNYPHDIHGAAQGILTFSDPENARAFPGLADKVCRWALRSMYHPEGRFYYQKTRFRTKRFTFLRWCNAWMCRAMAAHLRYAK